MRLCRGRAEPGNVAARDPRLGAERPWNEALGECQHGRHCLHGAARTEAVSQCRLEGGERHLLERRTEEFGESRRFRCVAGDCAGAVRLDPTDLFKPAR